MTRTRPIRVPRVRSKNGHGRVPQGLKAPVSNADLLASTERLRKAVGLPPLSPVEKSRVLDPFILLAAELAALRKVSHS